MKTIRPITHLQFAVLVWIALVGTASAQMVTLPNVIGMTEAQAREALTVAGVEGKLHAEVDKGGNCARIDIEEGHVCGQSPGVAKKQAAFLDVWLVLQGRRARDNGMQVQAAPEISMPSVDGWPESQAIEKLVAAGFTGAIEVQPSPEECRYPEGSVCYSQPGARSSTPLDANVVVYIQPERTLDSRYERLPKVVGMPIDKVIDALFVQNFRTIEVNIKDDVRCESGIVCEVNDAGKILLRAGRVYLTIGTAYPGQEKEPYFRVPDFRGDDLIMAVRKLDALGSSAGVATDTNWGRCNSDETKGLPPRTVCRQSPAPGRKTGGRTRTSVKLTADALHSPQVTSTTMPDVVGKTVEEASARLKEAGITRTRVKEKDAPNCQPGTVCATNPAAGKKVYPQVVQTLYIGATEAMGTSIGEALAPTAGEASEESAGSTEDELENEHAASFNR